MELDEIKGPLCARRVGANAAFQFVSTDTRTLNQGDLYVALTGPNFDGHDFVKAAEEKGAVAAIVSCSVECAMPTLCVDDTLVALGELAALRRDTVTIPMIAVTGSCGKTTTKTMIAAILARAGETLSTEGTLNNNIGVPLTLLRLTDAHAFGVIEMGANHMEEIAYLTQITRPTVVVISNAAPVHLEGFGGGVERVAQAKGEIFEGLVEGGTAVLNADDAFFNYWQGLAGGRRVVSFGLQAQADIRADDVALDKEGCARFVLKTPLGEAKIHLQNLGEHSVLNALAASAAAYAVGASLGAMKAGLEGAKPVDKRMIKRAGLKGSTILDDSYNGNPTSLAVAMRVLLQGEGETVLVVGDMMELGEHEQRYHQALGLQANALGIDRVFALGRLTPEVVKSFGENAQHFQEKEQLIHAVQAILHKNMTVLVKGSKVNRMWEIVEGLTKEK